MFESGLAEFVSFFNLQVGECQEEGSSSGKQDSQGRGDLWVHSQGDRSGRESDRREAECRESKGKPGNKGDVTSSVSSFLN